MRKTTAFLSLLVCAFMAVCSANEAEKDLIRITSRPLLTVHNDAMPIKVLLCRTKTITIGTTEYLNVYDGDLRAFLSGFTSFPVTVTIKDGKLAINDELFSSKHLFLLSPSEEYTVNNKRYKGSLKIVLLEREFMVINEVPLETYVKGVLPSEMYSKWPKEALKAQAVAARTYAVFSAIEKSELAYHVSDSQLSQVYGGESAQVKETDEAVEATRGEILTYAGEVFPTYFHSTCGGHTTNAEYVWDVMPHPALTAVYCPFCWESKYYTWTTTIKINDLEKRLRDKTLLRGDLIGFQAGRVDAAGRALDFYIQSDIEMRTINANELRVFVLPDIMKSTMFTLKKTSDEFIFEGFGWGHGVGMCQWGASKMAADGYDYKVIVSFYYPRTMITKLPAVDHEYYDLIICEKDENRSI
jgi:stage II sporulation protein D